LPLHILYQNAFILGFFGLFRISNVASTSYASFDPCATLVDVMLQLLVIRSLYTLDGPRRCSATASRLVYSFFRFLILLCVLSGLSAYYNALFPYFRQIHFCHTGPPVASISFLSLTYVQL
jgi:hypothetical protein